MQETVLKSRIVDRMSLLRAHVEGRAEHGLIDATSALEVLYREVLNHTHGWNLTSTNFPVRDFPAVDLHDLGRRLAVQVTVKCDTAKIVKTQDTFKSHNLTDTYNDLIFVGIKSVTKSSRLEPWAQIFSQAQLLNLENLSLAQLQNLDDRLAASIPWHQFTQQSDRHCFDVVLGVLDRDAIRHPTQVEGRFDDMIDALTQIKQVINQGQIPGTPIQAKPLALYSAPYKQALEEIDTHVGQMKSIVQRNLTPYNYLRGEAARDVDRERNALATAVNGFCMQHNHHTRIVIWR